MKDLADVKWTCPVCGKENTFHVHAADVRLPIMTNADKIRNLSDDELAETLARRSDACQNCISDSREVCRDCWREWLGQEVTANDS